MFSASLIQVNLNAVWKIGRCWKNKKPNKPGSGKADTYNRICLGPLGKVRRVVMRLVMRLVVRLRGISSAAAH